MAKQAVWRGWNKIVNCSETTRFKKESSLKLAVEARCSCEGRSFGMTHIALCKFQVGVDVWRRQEGAGFALLQPGLFGFHGSGL
jgi:hypothetical protein